MRVCLLYYSISYYLLFIVICWPVFLDSGERVVNCSDQDPNKLFLSQWGANRHVTSFLILVLFLKKYSKAMIRVKGILRTDPVKRG